MSFITLSPTRDKPWICEYGSVIPSDLSVLAYTPFGDLLVQVSDSQQMAMIFTQPFDTLLLNASTVTESEQLIADNPDAHQDIFQPDLFKECAKLHGPLGHEQIYAPEPYLFLGGDGTAKRRRPVDLATYIELSSSMQFQ